ncbi:MAG: hypothetical protein IJJ69_14795, partial [Oscillospiraceae bacterium]|nr:hypothetical protein [Oscillospiraceae bacterium]
FTICPLAFCLIAEPFRRPAPPSAGEFRREDPAQLKSQTEKSDFSFVVLHGDREERTEKRIMLVCKALSLIVLGMILMTMIDYTISE